MQMLYDGRSFVDCIGTKRFKVLERTTRDGYNVARVEFFDDNELEAGEDIAITAMVEQCRNMLSSSILANEENFQPPQDITEFSWWIIEKISRDERIRYASLSCKSLKLRLQFGVMILRAVFES